MAFVRNLSLLMLALLVLPVAAQARSLKQGDSGTDVQHLNERLAQLSYLPKGSDSRSYGAETFHAVMAFQKIAGIGRDGSAGPQTRKRLDKAGYPQPRVKGKDKHIEIDISAQVALLVVDGKVKRTVAVSTAAPGYSTPLGSYKVFRKEKMSWSIPYKSWLPYASYFNNGIALHQYDSVPAYPASHGCVRVPVPFATELYSFAGFGTPVHVVA